MKHLVSLMVLVAIVTFSYDGHSSSRVIRDNRLKDLGITPTLGRGYSIATNTYQSTCMSDIKTTVPSYDMKYRYTEIERDWEQSFTRTVDSKNQMKYLFLKSNVNVHTETSGTTTYHYHYIFANIQLDSYYNSVDEGNSHLSVSAKSLLTKGDVVGFFDSCGPYYVRSIGRHSSYMALLRYKTVATERDASFELELKAKLRGFFVGGSSNTTIDGTFHQETEEKRLSIVSWAFGLGKDHLGDLIPTDISSFKKTVQDAIKSMQDASTGRITTIEVAPWIENTEFQDTLKLESEDDVLQFEKKKNMEANAELIAEIDRVDRGQMDQYYKAVNCRRILDEEYLLLEGEYAYNPDFTWFKDLVAPGREVTLQHLDDVVSVSSVETYLSRNQTFLYGAGGEEDGAVYCLNQIFDQGIQNTHFRQIPACVAARIFSVPVAPVLDHFCMPEFSKVTIPIEQ